MALGLDKGFALFSQGKISAWMKRDELSVPVTSIEIGDRRKAVLDPKSLAEMKSSLNEIGILSPISLQRTGSGNNGFPYRVIAGATRFSAWFEHFQAASDLLAETEKGTDPTKLELARRNFARWQFIPAFVFSEDTPAEVMQLVEIDENLIRSDLTKNERIAWSSERAVLAKKLGVSKIGDELSELKPAPTPAKVGLGSTTTANGLGQVTKARGKPSDGAARSAAGAWFKAWSKDAGMVDAEGNPSGEAKRVWSRFVTEFNLTCSPSQATDAQQEMFHKWNISRKNDGKTAEKEPKKIEKEPVIDAKKQAEIAAELAKKAEEKAKADAEILAIKKAADEEAAARKAAAIAEAERIKATFSDDVFREIVQAWWALNPASAKLSDPWKAKVTFHLT